MTKYLYIVDARDNWAYAADEGNIHEWLAELDSLWEEYEPPITVNVIEEEL